MNICLCPSPTYSKHLGQPILSGGPPKDDRHPCLPRANAPPRLQTMQSLPKESSLVDDRMGSDHSRSISTALERQRATRSQVTVDPKTSQMKSPRPPSRSVQWYEGNIRDLKSCRELQILSFHYYQQQVGAAFYDSTTSTLSFLEDTPDSSMFDVSTARESCR